MLWELYEFGLRGRTLGFRGVGLGWRGFHPSRQGEIYSLEGSDGTYILGLGQVSHLRTPKE